jgi:similar to stage IV sporulation protein
MKANGLAVWRGYVQVRLIGGHAQAFLKAAVSEQIFLWNIAYNAQGELTFYVSVPDFFRLPRLLRLCGARPEILLKGGFPFQMAKLSRRKTFGAGMVAFILLLYILSNFVWQVRIEGESAIPKETILQAARQEGLYQFQWAPRMPKPETLSKRLAARLPDAAWVGVEKKGTAVTITVVDSVKPEARPTEGPRDLVSSADAVITSIVAESGKPLVKRHDRVRKGQVLITGWLGNEERRMAVVSRGKVMGLVWHEVKIVSPQLRVEKTLTGAAKDRTYFLIGNRALQISGYGGEPFAESRTGAHIETWRLFSWKLPFGLMKEREWEVETVRKQLTAEEAKQAGLAHAREQLLQKWGPDARITSENILHEQIENGKVVLTVLFELEQSIAVERPIVQTPGGQGE